MMKKAWKDRTIAKKALALVLAAVVTVPAASAFSAQEVQAAGNMVTVGLTKAAGSSVSIGTKSINIYLSPMGPVAQTLVSEGGFTIVNSGGSIVIKGGGADLATYADAPYIQGESGLTQVGSVSYRGYILPEKTGSGIQVVNVVDAEEYLYGVVPAEMPASWHLEALKAQSVAARSYMENQRGRHASAGYDICDTTHCQVYAGTSKEHENSTAAVQQTAGQLAYHNGSVIDAVFHSSSGGHTENAENVWVGAHAYLVGKPEPAENECLEWERTYTMEQLAEGLRKKGVYIGTISSITAEFSPSGRAIALTFNGTSGTKTYEKDAIRGVFSGIDSSLPSTLFSINGYGGLQTGGTVLTAAPQAVVAQSPSLTIAGASGTVTKNASECYALSAGGTSAAIGSGEFAAQNGQGEVMAFAEQYAQPKTTTTVAQKLDESTVTINTQTITLVGRGFGHGVGMSQYGAKGMAEAGHSYIQILQHYFTGIEVR